MFRFAAVSAAVAIALTVGLSAQAKKYGKPLTLKEVTKVSAIYAAPEKFNGKRVQVQGPIVEVCEEMGCWIALGSDKEFQTIRFKVDDGVIVFPMSAKGLNATVEGVIDVATLSVDDQIKAAQKMAEEMKHPVDTSAIKGPKVNIQIKGEGAEVK